MSNARYIGRVGGLAVALGVGMAVATTPGVAWAEDTGSASSGDATKTASAGGTGGTSESEGTSTTTGSTTGAAGTSTASGSQTDGAATPGSGAADAFKSGTSASTDASVRQVPPGTVLATGGADSSSKSSSETPATGDVGAESTLDDSIPPKGVADSTATDPGAPAAVTASVGGPRGRSNNRQQLVDEPSGAPGGDANTLTVTSGAPPSRPRPSGLAGTLVDIAVNQPAAPPTVTALAGTGPSLPQTFSGAAQVISAAPAQPTPPRSEVSGMVLGLLAGLHPLTPNGSPVDSPLGLALMAVGARPRQFGQAGAEESRSLPVSPTLTSQAIDTVATKQSQQTVIGDASTFGLAAMSTGPTVAVVTSAALMTSAAPVSIATGSSPTGVLVSPDRTRVYVANTGSNTVSVFNADPSVTTVISTVSVGSSPSALAISADGTRLYVANTGSGTVSVININTATNTYQRIDANPSNTFSMDIGVGSSPSALALSGNRLYVANRGANTVSVIDTATNKVIDANPSIFFTNIGVGSSPSALALGGTRLYVANTGSNTVSVINTATNRVTNTITVGSQPSSVAVSPNGTRVYVANTGNNTVSVINFNTTTNAYTLVDTNPNVAGTQSIFVGSPPSSVAVSPDGARAYVALSSDMVAMIETSSNVASLAPIDEAPELGAHSLALGPDGAVYVTDGADRALRSVPLVDGASVTIGRSTVVLPNSNGYAVPATWYFPHHDDAPVGLIYLQHGAWRTDTNVSALAQQLADRTNSIVVAPTVPTNAFDRYHIANDPIERAVAALFVGDRSALTASAAAAAGHPVTLPQQVVLAGHSYGGNLVAAAAGYLADAGGAANLKGVILLDAVHDGDGSTGMAKLTGAKAVPVMSISAPPCSCNNNGAQTTTTINAAPDKFVGIMLNGGRHLDAEGASTDSTGISGCGPAPTPPNAAAVQTITAAWINDVFTGSHTGIYAPAGTVIAVNGATAQVLAVKGLSQSATAA